LFDFRCRNFDFGFLESNIGSVREVLPDFPDGLVKGQFLTLAKL
jgi:hypothetical protein